MNINKEELLNSLNESLKESSKKNVIIGGKDNLDMITTMASGSLRINRTLIKKFKLILSNPLNHFERSEIHCCLCDRVINYPCYYWSIKYAVNQFHFFVCFGNNSSKEVSVSCLLK